MSKRRIPKQARSIRRYHHMLDTAARLFAEQGVDQVSTNHIAAAAEVSIGSLYQFFPNKEAMIEGLVERYMQQFAAVFPRDLDPSFPIEAVIQKVLTEFVAFNRNNQGVQTILIGLEGTSNADAAIEMQQGIVDNIDRVLSAYYANLKPARRRLCAQVSFQIVMGIMPLPLSAEALVAEMVMAVSAYQKQFLSREAQLTQHSQNR